ncbi:MAG TPA: ABC transporter permease [Candidatus Bipolaricaulis anaerobius]|nr:ABC transporter permease [Candidatus Bipolaricaulis anaerobius]HNS23703.1 ABC transporter permease [Candidatus Bipolaricaulis anaerobius]
MVSYIMRRVLALVPTLFLVLAVSFFLIHFIPGDPAVVMLGPHATVEQIEALRHEMGLDQPIGIQFGRYIVDVFHGDFGNSIFFHIPVTHVILQRVEPSVLLALCSMVVVFVIGIPSGILAAAKPNTWLDQAFLVIALLGASIPSFWLGLLLMLVFAVNLGWLPSSGFPSVFETGNISNLRYLVLPSITLGFANAALLARLTRSSVLDVLQEDYINTARAKGVAESCVLLRHALRNAAIPIVTVLGFTFAGLLSATVVTESVFALPGIGRLIVESVLRRDYPVIQGVMVFVAFLYLSINLLTDMTYAMLDPRIHYK